MDVVFEDKALAEIADAGRATGLGPAIDRKFRQRIDYIRAAEDERDFYAMKSLHFEKMRDNEGDERSMRLNDQWRLIVRLEGKAPKKRVVVVAIRDYH